MPHKLPPKMTQHHPMNAELATIQARFTQEVLKQRPPAPEAVESAASTLSAEGFYPDLDYHTRAKIWLPAIPHLDRLFTLVLAYRHPESPFRGEVRLAEKIGVALDYWFSADPQTDHTWFLEIGAPIKLCNIALLLEGDPVFTAERRELASRFIAYGYRDGSYMYYNKPATGQNLIWVSRVVLVAALLRKDAAAVGHAVAAFATELVNTNLEGIQADHSFHQHGAQLYSGGYGSDFSKDTIAIASHLSGTGFALSRDQINLLSGLLLDGQQWMIRGQAWDFGVVGREIARPGKNAIPMAGAAEMLSGLCPERSAEAKQFAARLRGDVSADTGVPEGVRVYWKSDYIACQRRDWLVSMRGVSKRIKGTESGNGENEKGYYLPLGALCLMRTGREYQGIFPLWDWRSVPGVTAVHSPRPLPVISWGRGAEGTTDFVGGATDGSRGAFAFDYRDSKEGLSMRRACFFFRHEVVNLGAALHSETDFPVRTSLDQRWFSGAAYVVDGEGSLVEIPRGEKLSFEHPRSLSHDGVRYSFLSPVRLTVQRDFRKGNWREINRDRAHLEVSGEVFQAYLDHGTPTKQVSFAYVIEPAAAQRHSSALNETTGILANTESLQAVWHPEERILQAVFYQAGSLPTPVGLVKVDTPCILLGDFSGAHPQFSLADPAQQAGRVCLELDNRAWSVKLPVGAYAGSSVQVK